MHCIASLLNTFRKQSATLGIAAVLFIVASPEISAATETPLMQTIIDTAQKLAAKPFESPAGKVPEVLLKIKYDQWRDIRFKPEMALWRKEKLPFQIHFFHPGFFYDRTVAVNIVEPGGIKPVSFSPALFDYGKNSFKDKVPANLGFAGLRIHYPINTKDYHDEVAVFLGASYFRAVAKNQNYGLSARALAIDTASATGEEFPYFREFWIVKPAAKARTITLYALLDSTSLTGAYRFVIRPGKETVMEVTCKIFRRKNVGKLGIAPLTSMFFYGENINLRPLDDFRPEVHDSDGIMIAFNTGEWLWRPLINPPTLQVNAFKAPDVKGFGLLQRDQDFNSYQDLESHYENRPSVWVTPGEKWGNGHIELVQIPTENELNDNITVYWVSDYITELSQPLSFSYTLSWYSPGSAPRPPAGRVLATRTSKGADESMRKFLIDFIGGELEQIPSAKELSAVITVDGKATITEQQLFKNTVTGGWRLVFQIRTDDQGRMDRVIPQKRQPVDVRAFLKDGDNVLTETWSYLYLP